MMKNSQEKTARELLVEGYSKTKTVIDEILAEQADKASVEIKDDEIDIDSPFYLFLKGYGKRTN